MKGWGLSEKHYCVSKYSMLIIFFNAGYVFRVELRYVPDFFIGGGSRNDSCEDETTIFDIFAAKIGRVRHNT